MAPNWRLAGLLVTTLAVTHVAALDNPFYDGFRSRRYREYFPQFHGSFADVIKGPCRKEYQYWLNASSPECVERHTKQKNPWFIPGCVAHILVDCVYKTESGMTESWRISMSGAAIVLGLLPTMIALSGGTTLEMGLLAFRRPFLAMLLSVGSPCVNPTRTFEYGNVQDLLKPTYRPVRIPNFIRKTEPLWVALQYSIVAAACGNVPHVAWDLSTIAICAVSIETGYLPLLWNMLSITLFLGGLIAVRLRLRLVDCAYRENAEQCSIAWRLARLMRSEFTLNSAHETQSGVLALKEESFGFVIASWLVSTLTVVYIVIGTWFFSNMLMIGHQDAAWVVFRYFVSTVACRAILMIEIAGMKQTVVVDMTAELEHAKEMRDRDSRAVVMNDMRRRPTGASDISEFRGRLD